MDVRYVAIRTILWLVLPLSLFSCKRHSTRFVADVGQVDVEIGIRRFDKDVLVLPVDSLYDRYGDFVNLYAFKILNLHNPQDIKKFTSDSIVSIIYADAEKEYDHVQDIERELSTAFKYFNYYFPTLAIPEMLFHVSGFNQSVVITDDAVSASIDLYLGSDYKYYEGVANQYELPLMTRERLPLDMAYAWISTEFLQEGQDRLIDNMLYRGKLLYMMMVMFPNRNECDILGYTPEQLAWAKLYEENIWASMMEKKQLFSSDWRLITQMVNPAPFTQGFSQDSPGRLGEYIGLQIVKSYMENNRNLTLYDMFAATDAEQLLRDSQYRP